MNEFALKVWGMLIARHALDGNQVAIKSLAAVQETLAIALVLAIENIRKMKCNCAKYYWPDEPCYRCEALKALAFVEND